MGNILPFLNRAPVIISEPIITAKEDQLYSYQIKASDPDGDNLNYSLIIKPEGMSINTEKNGLITWMPTNNQVGIHQVIVEISDGKYKVQQIFEIEVINVNNPPQILSYFPVNLNIEINEGDSVKFEIQATDVDLNTTLDYRWFLEGGPISNSSGIGSASKSTWKYFSEYGDCGIKTVKVLVSDGEFEDSVQWKITIKDITPPNQPILNNVTSPTNVSLQILTGTKEANSSIWINGIEAVSLNSSTDWSYSLPLIEGENNLSITSRDISGNESTAVTTIIILDTINPAAPTLDAVLSPTNVSPQTLSGTKETNTSVWINNIEIIPVNPSTTWTYDFYLSEGENNISITCQDSAGNESDEASTKIILDTISPAVPTLNEVITPTNISSQILSGTKETNTAIWINGIEAVSLNSSPDWSYSFKLIENENNISITSCDVTGNESSVVTAYIVLDTIKPEAPTLNAVISPTNISSQALSGTKEVDSSILINSIEVIPINSSTEWSYYFDLSERINSITITSKDNVGNESTAIIANIILDTVPPEVLILNLVTSPTNISFQTLSGTKEANTAIWINGAEVISINSDTIWSYFYNLSEGTNNISISSLDTAGNESSAVTAIIEYDPNTYVDAGNASGTEDGTETHPFNTIAEGIDAVPPGKSVIVAAGTYNEKLIINKGIVLQGAGKESTFINGLGYAGNLITIEADNVTISGFTIDGKSDTDIGIYSNSYSSIEISENLIQSQQDSGIFYQRISDDYSSGIYVYNNEICFNLKNGIKVIEAGSGIVESNSIRKNNYGILVCNSASLEVKQNNIFNNYDSGIFCQGNSSLLIWGNEITINAYGIRVGAQSSDTTNPDIGGGAQYGIGQNKIAGNTSNGVRNITNHNIFAKYNWWGAAAGPKYPGNISSSGDWAYWSATGGDIVFYPWLSAAP